MNDDRSPLLDLMTYIVCKRTIKLEKVDPDGEGKKSASRPRSLPRHLRGDIVLSPRIALIDDLQSWKVLSVLEPV